VPLAERQIAVLQLVLPDWLTAGFGSVWVKRDDGPVLRIDPGSHEIVATIPGEPCNGIGRDGTSIWTCAGSGLARIDPATNEVVDTVAAGKIFGQGRLVNEGGRVWVITGENGESISGIDAASLAVGQATDLGAACADLAAGGGAVWAACPAANLVLRIDPATGKVTDRVTVAAATQISVGADAVWVGSSEGLVRIGLQDRVPRVAVKGLVPGFLGSVWASADAVWVRRERPFLSRVDPATSRVVDTIAAPDYDGGGDVLGLDGTIWASAADDSVLVHLRAAPD
jgi:DNA-binding beta-propeller fold protein YncE